MTIDVECAECEYAQTLRAAEIPTICPECHERSIQRASDPGVLNSHG